MHATSDKWDTDKDGILSWTEFKQFFKDLFGENAAPTPMFELFDKDGDKNITKDEWMNLITDLKEMCPEAL